MRRWPTPSAAWLDAPAGALLLGVLIGMLAADGR